MNESERTTIKILTSIKAILCLLLQFSAILNISFFFLLPSIAMSATTDHQMTADETADLRKGLLKRFGLENVPMQSGPSIEIPKHVWDIYDDDNDVDWVRHYYPKEIVESNRGFMLSYNLSVAARNAHNEEVNKAILKLRLRTTNETLSNGNFSIYYLDEHLTSQKTLIESRFVSNISDWIDFDVTGIFHTTRVDMITLIVELPVGVEIDETQSSSMSTLPYAKAQSAPLIVFSDVSETASTRRRKRNAPTGNSERRNRKKGRKHHSYDAEADLCRKTDLYVDFDELGWQDWIMAPKGYDAFQCIGTCPNPMPAQLNASNHAIIQSLMNSVAPNDVPPPCCIPTDLSPLSILYMDIDSVIVIKEYADMRVESCGCR